MIDFQTVEHTIRFHFSHISTFSVKPFLILSQAKESISTFHQEPVTGKTASIELMNVPIIVIIICNNSLIMLSLIAKFHTKLQNGKHEGFVEIIFLVGVILMSPT